MEISLAPLQGYTDFIFRNAIDKYIGGVSKYYTPYLRLQNDGSLKSKDIRDVLPQNNEVSNLIPQILVNSSENFIWCCSYLEDMGYSEVNWNLGCPYPMVAKRKLGSGLLEYPDMIDSILDEALPKVNVNLSVKLRLGYSSVDDIKKVIPVLNRYQVKEVILHPRIGKELYKNSANIDLFESVVGVVDTDLAYNGDIENAQRIDELRLRFPEVSHFMVGRGLLKNPFLALEIKGVEVSEEEKRKILLDFYSDLFESYSKILSGNSHIMNKMVHLWEYLSFLFYNRKSVFKSIKKTKKVHDLNSLSIGFIESEMFR